MKLLHSRFVIATFLLICAVAFGQEEQHHEPEQVHHDPPQEEQHVEQHAEPEQQQQPPPPPEVNCDEVCAEKVHAAVRPVQEEKAAFEARTVELDNHIRGLDEHIRGLDEHIRGLDVKIQDGNGALENLRQELAAKSDKILELERSLEESKSLAAKHEETVNQSRKLSDDLTKELDSAKKQVDAAKKKVDEKDKSHATELSSVKKKLSEAKSEAKKRREEYAAEKNKVAELSKKRINVQGIQEDINFAWDTVLGLIKGKKKGEL